MNIDGAKYTFFGAPAHQMTAWNGRNALEAVIHLFDNIDAIRSNIRPEARIQGIITEGGAAPNVVPDRAAADFYIRYPGRGLSRAGHGDGRQRGASGGARDGHEGEDRSLRPESRRHRHRDARRGRASPTRRSTAPRTCCRSRASRRATRKRAACRATSPASASARRRRRAEPHLRDGRRRLNESATTASSSTPRRWRRCSSTSRRTPTIARR